MVESVLPHSWMGRITVLQRFRKPSPERVWGFDSLPVRKKSEKEAVAEYVDAKSVRLVVITHSNKLTM